MAGTKPSPGRFGRLGFFSVLIVALGNAQEANVTDSPSGVDRALGAAVKPSSSPRVDIGSLSAAELTALCFADPDGQPQLGGLERMEDAAENVDSQTLARYILKDIFLNPSKAGKSGPHVPLQDEILLCAPDQDAALASVEVLAACQTMPVGETQDTVQYLIEWSAKLTCTNSIAVLQGSVLDLTVGSVLTVSSSEPIQVDKLFVTN
jgi:hypothetical protein